MKNIFIGINKLGIGGAEQVAVSQARVLEDAGYTTYFGLVYDTDKETTLYDALTVPQGRIVHAHARRLWNVFALFRTIRFFKKHKIEIVITHLFDANTFFRCAAFCAGVKTIIAVEHSTYTGKRVWQRLVDRLLASVTDTIIAVSEEVATFTAAQEHIAPEKFSVVHQLGDFSLQNIFTRQEIRQKYTIPESALLVMTVGRLSPEKAQYRIVDIAEKLPDVFFCIVGYGPEEEALRARIQKKGLAKRVFVIVDPKRAKEYLVAGDVFISTSDREGLPIALLEGMYNGLAPVALAVGGIKDVITDGKNGYLVLHPDIEMMAQRINELAHDRAALEQMSEAARSYAKGYDTGAESFLNLVETLHGNHT